MVKFKEHLTTIIKNQEGDSIANKKSIVEKISTLNQQQERLDNTFLKGQIEGEKYGQLNTRIKNEIIELKSKISSITNDENDIERMIQSGLKKMTNFSETLDKVDIQDKRKILSSTFPEKIKIIDGRVRTPRLNSLVQYILLKNSKLQKEKAGQTLTFVGLSRLVEPAGVEPASKKRIRELSTCLFCGWFSTK